jgi:hypothetical protein
LLRRQPFGSAFNSEIVERSLDIMREIEPAGVKLLERKSQAAAV